MFLHGNQIIGRVGIAMTSEWCEPKDPTDPKCQAAAEMSLQSKLGWYSNPIFGNGDYPESFKKQIADLSQHYGMPVSQLPAFTEEEIELNRGRILL